MTLHTWKNLQSGGGCVPSYNYNQITALSAYMAAMLGQLTKDGSPYKVGTVADIKPILGVTASNNELIDNIPFPPTDAKEVRTRAIEEGWGYLSPWIVNQDYPCEINKTSTNRDASLCSLTVDQSTSGQYEFSKAYRGLG